ncbi:DsbA family protein [Blastococcus sp. SYSU D00820]
MADADLHFYFDPVCPFAWLTSRWVRMVAARRTYRVEWRFISLRLLNEHVDYAAQFPPDYEAGHTAGLRLLRLAAAVRAGHGQPALDRLYPALGTRVFETAPEDGGRTDPAAPGTAAFVAPVLDELGLPADLAAALDDDSWDAVVRAETQEALALTGRDVGTPILHFRPPQGTAFFGPVISRLPAEDQAEELWDHVVGLASFPGFAELKRSLREAPQVRTEGLRPGEVGREEDWHGGSRRLHR